MTPRPAREVSSGCQHLLHHWTWLAPAPWCQRCTPSLPQLASESQVLGGGGCVDDEQLRGVDDNQTMSSFSDQLVLQGGPPSGRPRKMEAPQAPFSYLTLFCPIVNEISGPKGVTHHIFYLVQKIAVVQRKKES